MENEKYLTEQIITYLGNKRRLLSQIEDCIKLIKEDLGKEKLVSVDLFSGSGIVARLLKQYSDILYVNDLENYSTVINSCYLSNSNHIDWDLYDSLLTELKKELESNLISGIITENYAPKDDNNIKEGERVFFTNQNAKYIDTIRNFIEKKVPLDMQNLFLAPLLYEASVHNNTSGVFKGFYKSKTENIGKFGGEGENALERIKGKIEIQKPVLSNFNSKFHIYQQDANELVKILPECDIIYIDPPYNQHPYGSNYFMLNTIIDNKINGKLSDVAGIPDNWNKSNYNKKNKCLDELKNLIENIKSKYIILSYSSEGFINIEDIKSILIEKGELIIKEIDYPVFRASRNLNNRTKTLQEYLFIVKVSH